MRSRIVSIAVLIFVAWNCQCCRALVSSLSSPSPKTKIKDPIPTRPVLIGTSDYCNILFGKFQRSASLWGTNLRQPMSILRSNNADAPQRLEKCLWNQFCMANIGSDGLLEEGDLLLPLSSWIPEAFLEGDVLFFDAIQSKGVREGQDKVSMGFLSNLFGSNPKKQEQKQQQKKEGKGVSSCMSPLILKCAAQRQVAHVYVLTKEDKLSECRDLLANYASTIPSTIVCLASGLNLKTSKDWYCSRPQDMEGELTGPVLLLENNDESVDDEGMETIPTEDAAEVMMHIALRTDRSPTEYPRIVYLAKTIDGKKANLIERRNPDYLDAMGGKKNLIQSAGSWSQLLAPLGKVNQDLGRRPDSII